MGAPLLEVRGLAVEIPVPGAVLRPVRGIDLSVAEGETLAIVGESGCGKSMTALAVMGLLPRTARLSAERIALRGQSLLGLRESAWRGIRGDRIAMIFQDPMTSLDPCYRVGDRIAVMYAGEIVETGTPDAVLGRPLPPYTEGLMRSIPVPGETRPGEVLGY